MGSSTRRTLRLGFSITLALAVVIGAAILLDRIAVLRDLLAWSWIPAVVLSLVLLGAAAGVAFALQRPASLSAEAALPEAVISRPSVPQCRRQPAVISVHGLDAQAGC